MSGIAGWFTESFGYESEDGGWVEDPDGRTWFDIALERSRDYISSDDLTAISAASLENEKKNQEADQIRALKKYGFVMLICLAIIIYHLSKKKK